MSNIADDVLKTIQYALEKKMVNCDRTYKTIIKQIAKKGYVILDDTGNERTVQCCIPGIELRVGQSVWVKEPMGDIEKLHICGVAGK